MDIQQAMALLQQGQQGQGMDGMQNLAALNPYGALQPGVGPEMAPAAPPDYNAILQQHLVNKQAEQAQMGRLGAGPGMDPRGMGGAMQAMMAQKIAERLGARTGGALQFDPAMGIHDMRQQFRDWRQAGNEPVRPFGGGGMGFGQRPPGGMGGAPGVTPPANVATLPGAGAAAPIQSGLGADYMKQRGRMGGGGGGFNQDTNAY